MRDLIEKYQFAMAQKAIILTSEEKALLLRALILREQMDADSFFQFEQGFYRTKMALVSFEQFVLRDNNTTVTTEDRHAKLIRLLENTASLDDYPGNAAVGEALTKNKEEVETRLNAYDYVELLFCRFQHELSF